MSRWHLESCTVPNVVLHDHVPTCWTCKVSPDLEGLVQQQTRLESEYGQPWTVPKNDPIGGMNLFWPSNVQYSRHRGQEATDNGEQRVNNSQLSKLTCGQNASTEPPSPQGSERKSYVYERRLGAHEFRLVCLSGAHHHLGVVHITLETYPNDDCPEYETVSYAWGGEDGNSNQNHPVYVGEYWDVMLHTNNCWSLLAYLQPRRGIRLVWIDSISINQRDNKEKFFQVGSMGERYRNCTRVVIYLGPNYAAPRATGVHPRRIPFHEMPDETFQRISRARYFRRIWIVQELVMAPSAIIPVDGTDFVIGGNTIAARSRMGHDTRWDDSHAPWMSQISTGGTLQYQEMESQLFQALQLTLHSESSDPRDRIFGILGLIHSDAFPAANYDISPAHVTIGLFSHIILNLKHLGVLLGASSPKHYQSGYPTWLPNWKSSITFAEIKYPPDASTLGLSQALQDLGHAALLETPEIKRSEHMEAIVIILGHRSNSLPPSYSSCGLDCDKHQVLRIAINAQHHYYGFGNVEITSMSISKRISRALFNEKAWGFSLGRTVIPWDEGAHISSTSGALSLHLTHLLQFTAPLEVVMEQPSINLLRVRSRGCNLFLGTLSTSGLNFPDLEHGSKDLFMIPGNEESPALILFMKACTDGSGFELSGCCYCVDLFFMTSNHFETRRPPTNYTEFEFVAVYYKVQCARKLMARILDGMRMRGVQAPPAERGLPYPPLTNQILPSLFNWGFRALDFEPFFPVGEWSEWEMLFVMQGLINQQDGKPGGFLTRYQEYLSKREKHYDPQLAAGHLEVTVSFKEWGSRAKSWGSEFTIRGHALSWWSWGSWGPWEFKNEDGRWEFSDYPPETDSGTRIRILMDTLERRLSHNFWYWILRQFTPYSRKSGVDEYEIIRGGPKEEYRSEFSLDFPEEIREAFNVDMWTRLVTIV